MDLIARLKILAAEERRVTAEFLKVLLEVEDKKLFAERGFASVYELCVKELGYSEGAAYRRVSAMRLLRREESCAEKIASGELSLSNAAKVETVLKQARRQKIEVSAEEQAGLFEAACGKSSKEAEKEIAKEAASLGIESPRPAVPLPAAIEEKLAKLRILLAQDSPKATSEELLHRVLDEALEKLEKTQSAIAGDVRSPKKRHVPQRLRRALFKKAGHQCEFKCAFTGKRCESKRFLEVDHVIPFSMGGRTVLSNLRILCRTHNQFMAEKAGLARPAVKPGSGTGSDSPRARASPQKGEAPLQ